MNINKENYGSFIIDYYEDLLSEIEKELLLVFFDNHPELKWEFYDFVNITLPNESLLFTQKDKLKKPPISTVSFINENNFEEYMVWDSDGELTTDQQNVFENFLQSNTFLKAEMNRIALAKVKPDKEILFPGKTSLEKRRIIPLYFRMTMAAAAILLGMLIINPFGKNINNRVAKTDIATIDKIPSKLININLLTSKQLSLLLPNKKTFLRPPHKTMRKKTIVPIELMKKSEVVFSVHIKEKAKLLDNNIEILPQIADYIFVEDESPKHKTTFIKIITKPFNNIADFLAIRRRAKKQNGIKEPSILKIIDNSVKVFNTVTGADVAIAKVYNNKGTLKTYYVFGNNWQIIRQSKFLVNEK